MAKKTSTELADQSKQLIEWAEGTFFESQGQVSQFLKTCKDEGREPTEVVSYTEFLVLKEKFEA